MRALCLKRRELLGSDLEQSFEASLLMWQNRSIKARADEGVVRRLYYRGGGHLFGGVSAEITLKESVRLQIIKAGESVWQEPEHSAPKDRVCIPRGEKKNSTRGETPDYGLDMWRV